MFGCACLTLSNSTFDFNRVLPCCVLCVFLPSETSDLVFCVSDLQFSNQKLQQEVRKLKQSVETMEDHNQKLAEENEELKSQARLYGLYTHTQSRIHILLKCMPSYSAFSQLNLLLGPTYSHQV